MLELNKIYNEDCLETMARMEDNSVDLIFADPQYNVGKKYTVGDDNKNYWEYHKGCVAWFKECIRVSKKIIITPGTQNLSMWIADIKKPTWIGSWNKPNACLGSVFANLAVWEPILFYFNNINGRHKRDQWTVNIRVQKDIGAHPCPKPKQLLEYIIDDFSDRDNIIYDPFMGSGTTALAAEKYNRQWIGSEINPEYCDIANKRISAERNQTKLF